MSIRRKKPTSYSQKIDNLYGPLRFAWMIKALREEAKINQDEMAAKMGMTLDNYKLLESGTDIPSPQFIVRIAKKLSALGLPAMGLIQLAVRDARFQKAGVMRF